MPLTITIHYDNFANYRDPVLIFQDAEKGTQKVKSVTEDEFGRIFEIVVSKNTKLHFKFGEDDLSKQEDNSLIRTIVADQIRDKQDFWCRGWHQFVYVKEPQIVHEQSASEYIDMQHLLNGIYISDSGGRFALGATKTANGILFGIFHPHATRIFVMGDFNNWQYPDATNAKTDQFLEMSLHQGYFGVPNIWYLESDQAQVGEAYKFYIEYNCLSRNEVITSKIMVDPYARFLDSNYEENNGVIINPRTYEWHDHGYQTPAIHDLIIYELHVHGFTHEHPNINKSLQGTYQGIGDLIEKGYFEELGVTCLYLMPISEVPTPQSEDALGYNSSLFMAIERDFGTPDDLRQLVDMSHQRGMAVIIDQVFNHSANSWNPLWQHILDYPEQAMDNNEGGLYFSGSSPWGNRIATERIETQNMLIDACKLMIVEYHIDGFRFDATNSMYMDHGFLQRLADELQALKPNIILIAENLPNETDLNREGYNGYSQWCDFFHDTIKALLREGEFEGTDNHPEQLGDIFYFSKGQFATHTNNVINYCESHDEHSVAHEISFVEALNTPATKERKARLGLFATLIALGQPMLYMGQEFGVERARNLIYFDFPENWQRHSFFQWASRLIKLRKRYPALKLHGFNPIEDGQFTWIAGSWLGDRCGSGKRVLGWRARPTNALHEAMLILINLENHPVEIDIHFDLVGQWVRLASIDTVNDIAPFGNNHIENDDAITVTDGIVENFVLPDSSAFIYKWQAGL